MWQPPISLFFDVSPDVVHLRVEVVEHTVVLEDKVIADRHDFLLPGVLDFRVFGDHAPAKCAVFLELDLPAAQEFDVFILHMERGVFDQESHVELSVLVEVDLFSSLDADLFT